MSRQLLLLQFEGLVLKIYQCGAARSATQQTVQPATQLLKADGRPGNTVAQAKRCTGNRGHALPGAAGTARP